MNLIDEISMLRNPTRCPSAANAGGRVPALGMTRVVLFEELPAHLGQFARASVHNGY